MRDGQSFFKAGSCCSGVPDKCVNDRQVQQMLHERLWTDLDEEAG